MIWRQHIWNVGSFEKSYWWWIFWIGGFEWCFWWVGWVSSSIGCNESQVENYMRIVICFMYICICLYIDMMLIYCQLCYQRAWFLCGHGFCALFLQHPRFDYCFGGKEFAAEGVIVEHEAEIATAEAAASESALQWSRPDKSLKPGGQSKPGVQIASGWRIWNNPNFGVKMQLPLWLVTIFLGFKPSACFAPAKPAESETAVVKKNLDMWKDSLGRDRDINRKGYFKADICWIMLIRLLRSLMLW